MAPEPVIPPRNDLAEITRSTRDLPPAHYTFKIENFSLLANAKIDNVESGDFEAGSYKWYVGFSSMHGWPQMVSLSSSEFTMFPFFPWLRFLNCRRLRLYPNGNKKSNGDGHISLYLAFSDSNAQPFGWEVNVNFRLFVYNQIQDKYLTIQCKLAHNLIKWSSETGLNHCFYSIILAHIKDSKCLLIRC